MVDGPPAQPFLGCDNEGKRRSLGPLVGLEAEAQDVAPDVEAAAGCVEQIAPSAGADKCVAVIAEDRRTRAGDGRYAFSGPSCAEDHVDDVRLYRDASMARRKRRRHCSGGVAGQGAGYTGVKKPHGNAAGCGGKGAESARQNGAGCLQTTRMGIRPIGDKAPDDASVRGEEDKFRFGPAAVGGYEELLAHVHIIAQAACNPLACCPVSVTASIHQQKYSRHSRRLRDGLHPPSRRRPLRCEPHVERRHQPRHVSTSSS